jgi:hypothetical protein|tara:strand:- start:22 stop:717 length:696 start_codon:yes stop_codon:yes gene_type:complete
MGGNSARSGGNANQVSGNEAVITKQKKGTKNEINKGFNVSTYGDTNPATYDFVNSKTKKKPLPKYLPTALKAGIKMADVAGNIIDSVTDGARKNKQFMVDNYSRIGKNYNLPDRDIFNKMSTDEKNITYSDMRSNFMRNNLNPFGEKEVGGNGGNNTPVIIKKNIGGSTIQTTAPTEAEVLQSEATTSQQNLATKKKKIKAKGQSMTILTSSKGVNSNEGLTLGKKSLLGA